MCRRSWPGAYDALIWIPQTSALSPLHREPTPESPELETEPTGY